MFCNISDKDIVDIIHSHKNLKALAIAIANANFIPLLRSQKENFTFFAPQDNAFDRELEEMIINNHTATFNLLSRHKVVGHGRFTTDKIDKGILITVNNYGKGLIEIWRNGTTGALRVVERPGNNPYATIIERDIPASIFSMVSFNFTPNGLLVIDVVKQFLLYFF